MEGELGRGAFGAVFRMKHKQKGTIMAVKVSGIIFMTSYRSYDTG